MFSIRVAKPIVVCLCLFLLFVCSLPAQETTGGIAGTVKDPSGASVPNATVSVTAASLVGTKTVQTDASGYYRFANLPPGSYTLTVTATGSRPKSARSYSKSVTYRPSTSRSKSAKQRRLSK